MTRTRNPSPRSVRRRRGQFPDAPPVTTAARAKSHTRLLSDRPNNRLPMPITPRPTRSSARPSGGRHKIAPFWLLACDFASCSPESMWRSRDRVRDGQATIPLRAWQRPTPPADATGAIPCQGRRPRLSTLFLADHYLGPAGPAGRAHPAPDLAPSRRWPAAAAHKRGLRIGCRCSASISRAAVLAKERATL